MEAGFLALLMFIATCGVLLLGFPVAFTLAGVPLIFAFIGTSFHVFDLNLLFGAIPSRFLGVMTNEGSGYNFVIRTQMPNVNYDICAEFADFRVTTPGYQ